MSDFVINPDIPPAPRACYELLAIGGRNDVGAADVAQVIASDARMALEVIRVANSAFYARRTAASSARDAVVTMGVRDALHVALAVTLIGELLPRESQLRLDEIIDYGCVAAAAWARFGDATATAGMLTSVGLVAMAQYPDRFRTYADAALAIEGWEELHELEREVFGLTRCEMTDLVLARWEIAEPIADVLATWHVCRTATHELGDALRSRADQIESPLLRTVAEH